MKCTLRLFACVIAMLSAQNLRAQGPLASEVDQALLYSVVDKHIRSPHLDGAIEWPAHHRMGGAPLSLKKTNQVYFPDTVTVYSTTSTARYSLTYNTMGLPTLTLVEILAGGQWYNYSRLTIDYDAHGNTLSQLLETRSGGQWTNSTLDSWTYDAQGNSADVQQMWSGSQWIKVQRDSSTFDDSGNMLFHRYSVWATDHWKDSIQSWRTYDADGDMLTDFGQYMTDGFWVNHDQSAYTYDANGHQLTSLFQMWDAGQWKNSDRFTYTYDGNGNVLTTMSQSWVNNQWSDPYQSSHDYTYDGFGNKLTDLMQAYTNGQWTNQGKYVYTYDTNGNELTGSYTGWSNSSWKQANGPFVITLNGSDYYFSGYSINISYTLIHPSDVPIPSKTVAAEYSLFQNYPNPFNPTTVINGQWPADSKVRLVVYDVLGREVAVLADGKYPAGRYAFTFNGSTLASGVYFYRLTAGSHVAVRAMNLVK